MSKIQFASDDSERFLEAGRCRSFYPENAPEPAARFDINLTLDLDYHTLAQDLLVAVKLCKSEAYPRLPYTSLTKQNKAFEAIGTFRR